MIGQQDDRRVTPSKEEILAMTDVAAVEQLVDELSSAARKIEVDLEFCTEGSDDWEGRARGALAHHRVAIDRLLRRKRDLTGMRGPSKEEAKAEKAARKAASAAEAEAGIERRRLREQAAQRQANATAVAAAEKTKRQLISAIEKASFQAAFIAAAVERFTAEEMEGLYRRATEIQADRFRSTVELEQAA
ncbi:hypothetical protein [Caulobacter sp. NIBR2454]|uniref:hypothetical protein n=1 Tax=Caulobacter sp. NIBR2454 TaxID=3015996 RepID=UPI0022B6E643|nr:hypothetical protein [Caulobacter sp. NIBR2454]